MTRDKEEALKQVEEELKEDTIESLEQSIRDGQNHYDRSNYHPRDSAPLSSRLC